MTSRTETTARTAGRGGSGLRRGLSLAALVLAGAGTAAMAADGAAASAPMAPGMGQPHGMGPGAGRMPPEGGPMRAMHRPGIGGPGMGVPVLGLLMDGRLLDSVGASAEQKTRLRDIAQAAEADLAKLHEGQRALHQQMAELFAAPKVDAAAAEALRLKLNAGHDAASKRVLQAALDAQAVLTPEQRQQLAQRQKQRHEMMERHRQERDRLDGRRS